MKDIFLVFKKLGRICSRPEKASGNFNFLIYLSKLEPDTMGKLKEVMGELCGGSGDKPDDAQKTWSPGLFEMTKQKAEVEQAPLPRPASGPVNGGQTDKAVKVQPPAVKQAPPRSAAPKGPVAAPVQPQVSAGSAGPEPEPDEKYVKRWEVFPAPSDKNPSRHKLMINGAMKDVFQLFRTLGPICSGAEKASGDFNFFVYLSKLGPETMRKLEEVLGAPDSLVKVKLKRVAEDEPGELPAEASQTGPAAEPPGPEVIPPYYPPEAVPPVPKQASAGKITPPAAPPPPKPPLPAWSAPKTPVPPPIQAPLKTFPVPPPAPHKPEVIPPYYPSEALPPVSKQKPAEKVPLPAAEPPAAARPPAVKPPPPKPVETPPVQEPVELWEPEIQSLVPEAEPPQVQEPAGQREPEIEAPLSAEPDPAPAPAGETPVQEAFGAEEPGIEAPLSAGDAPAPAPEEPEEAALVPEENTPAPAAQEPQEEVPVPEAEPPLPAPAEELQLRRFADFAEQEPPAPLPEEDATLDAAPVNFMPSEKARAKREEAESRLPPKEEPKPAASAGPAPLPAPVSKVKARWSMEMPLIPTYNFQTLVAGSHNRFAHAAAMAVVENPGVIYNPLLIFGVPSTGKTHFVHAVSYGLSTAIGQSNIFVTDGIKLSKGVELAIREGGIEKLDEMFSKIRVLIIDDVHLLMISEANKKYISKWLQDFMSQDKQIMVTSVFPPKALSGLEETVDFQFTQGWMVDLKAPAVSSYKLILNHIMQGMDIKLSEDDLNRMFTQKNIPFAEVVKVFESAKKLEKMTVNLVNSSSHVQLLEMLLGTGETENPGALTENEYSKARGWSQKGKSAWFKWGIFYPKGMKMEAQFALYSMSLRAGELGLRAGWTQVFMQEYNSDEIYGTPFKIGNYAAERGVNGVIVLGPQPSSALGAQEAEFRHITFKILESYLLKGAWIGCERLRLQSVYTKALMELI